MRCVAASSETALLSFRSAVVTSSPMSLKDFCILEVSSRARPTSYTQFGSQAVRKHTNIQTGDKNTNNEKKRIHEDYYVAQLTQLKKRSG